MHTKLFIPGPVEVSRKNVRGFSQADDRPSQRRFQKALRRDPPALQELFGTKQPVFLSTSSAWGVMEGAHPESGCAKRCSTACAARFRTSGSMSRKRCGKEAEALQVEWGQPILPEAARRESSATGGFDAVTLIHNETSTGVMSPLREICEVMKKYPGRRCSSWIPFPRFPRCRSRWTNSASTCC